MVEKISMSVDETLELDYLVEDLSNDIINVKNEPSGASTEIGYMRKEIGVFDPPKTGTYQLDLNGQTIEIEVTDIPDSENLHLQWDLIEQPESDGQTVDPLINQVQDQDAPAVGTPTMDIDGLGSNPTAITDGSSDGWDVTESNFQTLSQPFTIYWVGALDGSLSSTHNLCDNDRTASGRIILQWWGSQGRDWRLVAGGNVSGMGDGSENIVAFVVDGADSVIDSPTATAVSGDAGTNDLTGLPWAHKYDGSTRSNFFDGRHSGVLIYDAAHNSQTRSEIYAYAQDRYDV